jgi:conjugal transfer pilus assembly protein TraF
MLKRGNFRKAALAYGLAMGIGSLAILPVLASESGGAGFYGQNSEGWFFYKDPRQTKPVPLEPEKVPSPPPVAVPVPVPAVVPIEPKKPEPFSVAWMKQKTEILRDNAIANPTQENARAYMYMQRLLLDMSENFATAGAKAAESDPYLNESVRFPTASAARRSALWQVEKARDAIIKDLSQKTALWFFFDSSCVHCHAQYPVMKIMASEMGFSVRNISEDGKPLAGMGQKDFVVDNGRATFKSLALKLTPAVVLVSPPNNFMVVAHGAMAADELKSKIVQAAIDRDMVPRELSDIAELEKRGIVSPDDVAKMKNSIKDTDDPKELVRMVHSAIGARMN